MNSSLKLFCFVLVTLPLVITTVSAVCDDSVLKACGKNVSDLTPAQKVDKPIVCQAKEDFINCQTSYLEGCPIFLEAFIVESVLNISKQIHSDVCGEDSQEECPNGYMYFQCEGDPASQEEEGIPKDACTAMRETYDCLAHSHKNCTTLLWMPGLMAQTKSYLESQCPSGVSMTMSSFWVVLTLSASSGLRQFM